MRGREGDSGVVFQRRPAFLLCLYERRQYLFGLLRLTVPPQQTTVCQLHAVVRAQMLFARFWSTALFKMIQQVLLNSAQPTIPDRVRRKLTVRPLFTHFKLHSNILERHPLRGFRQQTMTHWQDLIKCRAIHREPGQIVLHGKNLVTNSRPH